MNLCIDQGNSSAKIGIFEADRLMHTESIDELNENYLEGIFKRFIIDRCILSSVTGKNETIAEKIRNNGIITLELSHLTPIPISNRYTTPETLGKDRLAAVVGAFYLKPNTPLLVIDAGTAITYDFIDEKGNYWGGNIAPGLSMRLKAMHEFTAKLPLVEAIKDSPLLGTDTRSALAAGALQGIIFEIEGYFNILKIKYPELSTFLTGGSTFYFDKMLKNPIFAETNLVLIGLNRILQYNEQK